MADEDEQGPISEQGAAQDDRDAPPALVGVGVCAASLASLTELFANLTPGTNAAYLIAVRQKEGLDVSAVMATLEQASIFPAAIAVDGEQIVSDRIYVGAPDDLMTIEDGHLRVRPATEPVGHRGALDSLLISLAEHAHERAVAVILSGLGSEGSAGITATKKFGGLSIAEDADHGDLSAQGAADPAAVADLHLPVARIAPEIARYLRNLSPILQDEEREEASGDVEAQVTQVATILRNVTGHDFHGYKRGTFLRRIQRRIQVMQVDGGMSAYVERLRSDREEVQHLFQDLLIGVTQFFRDPAEFEALERELPRLFENKQSDDHFRVWVLGCATGEEAYSIAILLREYMATLDHPPEVQIFATDLDARALSLARAGRYADTIANHVRADRLERWFVREGDTYCVAKALREMCIFSPHNIVKDAPFSRIDVLSCRNLLIYLSPELQNRVIPIFHFSLRHDGVLFLGSSENVTRHSKLFAPVDRKSRVFRRLETATRIIPDFPLSPRARSGDSVASQVARPALETRLSASVSRQAEAVAERYAPAYVVVDTHGDILHFSGRTGRYLEPSAGIATLNLQNLVHRDLRLDVRSALARAIAERARVEIPRLTVRQDERTFAVNVIVEPLSAGEVTSLAVVFQDLGSLPDGGAADARVTTDEHVQRLEAELRVTRDRLQATIEELESTNEELKSSNEEYQSINEELQSANEEMETSKEELQSVNEELQTVNGELGHRVSELGRTNSDLKNLLESTQIATVFLDNDLRVRNFTPTATDVFHLLETDIGRPLDHVVWRVNYPELVDDVRRVLKTLVPSERQVSDETSGRHFSARVLPYRSVDNYINGAVVTFTDLTAVQQAQAALRESDAMRQLALESGRMGTWRWDLKARLVWGDAPFLALWGFEPTDEPLPLAAFTDRMSPEGAAEMEEIAGRAVAEDEEFDGPVEIASGPTGGRWVRWRGRVVPGSTSVLQGVTFDITEQRATEARLRASEERQQFLLALSDALRSVDDPVAAQQTAMRLLCERFEVSRASYYEVADDQEHFEITQTCTAEGVALPERHLQFSALGFLRSAYRAGETLVFDDIAADERLDGPTRAAVMARGARASVVVPLVKRGRLVAMTGVHQEASRAWTPDEVALLKEASERIWSAVERARAEQALAQSEDKYRTLFDSIDEGVATLDVVRDADGNVADMRHIAANPALSRLTGLPQDIIGKTIREVVPNIEPAWMDAYARVVATGAPERLEHGFAAADKWFDVYLSRVGGRTDQVITVFSDVTDRKRAENVLRESEQRQRALIEGIPQFVWRAVDHGEWTWASPQWVEYTGQSDAASRGWGWLEMIHDEDRVRAREAWASAEDNGFDVELRVYRAADGSYQWFRARAKPVRDERDAIIEWLGTSTDVDETRELQKRQETLVAELQHRVRNMLTVIRSVFAQTVASGKDLEEAADHFKGRLDALARTQVIVTRSAEGMVDLGDLIRDEFLSVGVSEGPKLRIVGPDVALPSKTAESIGLAIHELTTNAIKYGALKVPSATLDISWVVNMDHRTSRKLNLTWLEQGVPAVPTKPTREGFGRELIEEALPYRLGAETRLEFLGGGVRCAISVPLPAGDETDRSED